MPFSFKGQLTSSGKPVSSVAAYCYGLWFSQVPCVKELALVQRPKSIHSGLLYEVLWALKMPNMQGLYRWAGIYIVSG